MKEGYIVIENPKEWFKLKGIDTNVDTHGCYEHKEGYYSCVLVKCDGEIETDKHGDSYISSGEITIGDKNFIYDELSSMESDLYPISVLFHDGIPYPRFFNSLEDADIHAKHRASIVTCIQNTFGLF